MKIFVCNWKSNNVLPRKAPVWCVTGEHREPYAVQPMARLEQCRWAGVIGALGKTHLSSGVQSCGLAESSVLTGAQNCGADSGEPTSSQ